jgi:hypothetical protein
MQICFKDAFIQDVLTQITHNPSERDLDKYGSYSSHESEEKLLK